MRNTNGLSRYIYSYVYVIYSLYIVVYIINIHSIIKEEAMNLRGSEGTQEELRHENINIVFIYEILKTKFRK